MGGGYVLDFSNRTFDEFVTDSTARDIWNAAYSYGSGSKANRLRAFWTKENNRVIGKLLGDLLEYGIDHGAIKPDSPELEACRRTVTRLIQDSPVTELGALTAIGDERDFEIVAKAVKDTIDRNEPETGLDRLHTFVIKYVRTLCARRGIDTDRDKPLHSLFGEYIKKLREARQIESEMTVRILKSSISILEAFNSVRNNQSLAHDNPVLNYEEALLIFNHVASSMRFLRSLDRGAGSAAGAVAASPDGSRDDIPF